MKQISLEGKYEKQPQAYETVHDSAKLTKILNFIETRMNILGGYLNIHDSGDKSAVIIRNGTLMISEIFIILTNFL